MKIKHSCDIEDLFAVFEQSLTSADIAASRILADISVAITRRRKELDMTQKQFANYLDVSQGMISKWESSDYNFSIKTLADVAEKLDLELNVSLKKEINHYDATQNVYVFAIMSSEERKFDQKTTPLYRIESKPKMTMFNPKIKSSQKTVFEVVNSKQYNLMEG